MRNNNNNDFFTHTVIQITLKISSDFVHGVLTNSVCATALTNIR